jgi:hypothetical protein
MQIDKNEVVRLLRERGEHDKAEQAEQQLPQQVDHEEHSELLGQVGVEPQDLLSKAKSIL